MCLGAFSKGYLVVEHFDRCYSEFIELLSVQYVNPGQFQVSIAVSFS